MQHKVCELGLQDTWVLAPTQMGRTITTHLGQRAKEVQGAWDSVSARLGEARREDALANKDDSLARSGERLTDHHFKVLGCNDSHGVRSWRAPSLGPQQSNVAALGLVPTASTSDLPP